MSPIKHYLNFTDDLICIIDDTGRILDVNSNWKKLFQIGPTQGISFHNLLHEEHRPKVLSFFKDPRHSVMRVPECRFVDFTGKSYWLDLKIRRIQDENRYWCLLKDITFKKQIFSLLDQISENYNLGHWEYDSFKDEVKWSLKIYDIFHLNPISYTPTMEDMKIFFDKKDVRLFNEMIQKNPEFEYTFAYTDKFGEKKWIKLSGTKENFNDGHYALKGLLQDVTKEVRKERTQLMSNIELSSFEKGLEQFSIVARTDSKGKIIYANEEFCRISKYSNHELIGKDHRILNSGHHPASFFKEMWECIQSGRNWRGEIKNRAKDGSFYWVDTIIIPIRDNEGKLKEILSFRYEITALKRIQEENQILRHQLELLKTQSMACLWSFDFLKSEMNYDTETLRLLDLPSQYKLNYETVFGPLSSVEKDSFEACLKDNLKNDFVTNVKFGTRNLELRVKIIRNNKGEPVRMDGAFSHQEWLKSA